MEKQIKCFETEMQAVKLLAEELKAHGITKGADVFYEADDYSAPYFKIPKEYKKETESDPNEDFLYVDVDEDRGEYTVHGKYVHEHIGSAEKAAELAKSIFDGRVVELALVCPDRMAGFFTPNAGSPDLNADKVGENAEEIMNLLFKSQLTAGYHVHTASQAAFPFSLLYGASRQPQIEDVEIYIACITLGEHTEYYVVK